MRVAFVGNCQAGALHELFLQFVQPWTGDESRTIVSYRAPGEKDLSFIAQADIVIEQVFDFPQVFEAAAANPSGRIVRFPHTAAPFLSPYGLERHPRNEPHPALGDGPYPEACRYLRELMEQGSDPGRIVAAWLEADLGDLVPLDRIHELGLMAQRRRDEQAGFRCAEIIAARARHERCFLSVNHPTGPLLLYIVEEIFRRTGVDERLIARLPRLLRRWPMSIYEQPVHPSVARHFGLAYVTPDTRYAWAHEGRFTIAEWARRYVAYEWNRALHEGRLLLHTGHPAEAVPRLREAAAQPGSRAVALSVLGHALARCGEVEEGVATLRAAVALEPDDPEPRFELAEALHGAGRLEEAAACWAELAALDPRMVKAQARRTQALRDLGRIEEAMEAQRATLRLDPDNPILQGELGILLHRAGNAAEGAAMLARANAADWPGLDASLSFTLGAAGQIREALARARRALRRPGDRWLHSHIGNLLMALGEPAAAEAEYRAVLAFRPEPGLCLALASALHLQGRKEEAAEALRQALALDPHSEEARRRLAELLEGEEHEAAPHQPEASPANAEEAELAHDPALSLQAGWQRLEAGAPAEAEAIFRAALAFTPEDARLHASLGEALWAQGQGEAAVASARAAADREPSLERLLFLGHFAVQAGQPVASAQAFCEAAALAPGRGDILASLSHSLTSCGRWTEAALAAREAARLQPRNADLHRHLGNLLLGTEDAAGAEAAFRVVAALVPDDRGAHANIAEALVRRKRIAEAKSVLRAALAALPDAGLQHRLDLLEQLPEPEPEPQEEPAREETVLAPVRRPVPPPRPSFLMRLSRWLRLRPAQRPAE